MRTLGSGLGFEHLFDTIHKILRTERLGNVVIHLCNVKTEYTVDALGLGRDNDDRDILRFFVGFHLLVYFPTIHIRHHQVQQHQIGLFLADHERPRHNRRV